MTVLDIFVFLLLFGGAAVGFVRGFVHEVISLFAWVVAIAMLKLFHTPAVDRHRQQLPHQPRSGRGARLRDPLPAELPDREAPGAAAWRDGPGGTPVLGPFDRVLGGGFGALKGLLGVTLFFLLANLATDMVYGPAAERPQWMTKSRTYPLLNASGRGDRRLGRRRGAATRRCRKHDPAPRYAGAREAGVRSAEPERITMYVCGPTVYGRAHIGNARPAVVFDTLARLIRHEFGEEQPRLCAQRHRRRRQDHRGGGGGRRRAVGNHRALRAASISRTWARSASAPPDIAPHATQEIAPRWSR